MISTNCLKNINENGLRLLHGQIYYVHSVKKKRKYVQFTTTKKGTGECCISFSPMPFIPLFAHCTDGSATQSPLNNTVESTITLVQY